MPSTAVLGQAVLVAVVADSEPPGCGPGTPLHTGHVKCDIYCAPCQRGQLLVRGVHGD